MTAPAAISVAGIHDRGSARAFVDRYVRGEADEADRAQRIRPETLGYAAEAGLWGVLVPPEFGGRGVDMVSLGEIAEELGHACTSLRNLFTAHTMVCRAIDRWGTDTQRSRWLAALAEGDAFGAFCLSEPGGGAAGAHVSTTARPAGAGWLIDGHKSWITGGQLAGLLLVFAQTGDGVLPFLVPRTQPGVRITPISDMLGARASMLADISFQAVSVDADALVGPSRFARGAVMTDALDIGRYLVARGCVGILRGCVDACVQHAHRPLPGGGTLADHQLIRAKVAQMAADHRAADLLCHEAGRLKDRGDHRTLITTWMAKYFASRAAASAASDAVQILGAEGCGPGSIPARYYRDAKIMEIIEGSTEIQQLTIAAHVLGEAAR